MQPLLELRDRRLFGGLCSMHSSIAMRHAYNVRKNLQEKLAGKKKDRYGSIFEAMEISGRADPGGWDSEARKRRGRQAARVSQVAWCLLSTRGKHDRMRGVHRVEEAGVAQVFEAHEPPVLLRFRYFLDLEVPAPVCFSDAATFRPLGASSAAPSPCTPGLSWR